MSLLPNLKQIGNVVSPQKLVPQQHLPRSAARSLRLLLHLQSLNLQQEAHRVGRLSSKQRFNCELQSYAVTVHSRAQQAPRVSTLLLRSA